LLKSKLIVEKSALGVTKNRQIADPSLFLQDRRCGTWLQNSNKQ